MPDGARGGVPASETADTDRAAHAGAAEAAVTARVLRQVLLVVVLGEVELRRRPDLRGDLAVARRGEPLLEHVPRLLRGGALRVRVRVDAGAVLRADVVPLPHALRRVVTLPERAQEIVVGDDLGVED